SGPAWSPDGTKMAFVSNLGGNHDISVMNADGTNPTQLTNDLAQDEAPAWSPDGTRIAFTSNRGGNDEAYVMGADGSGQTRLTQTPGGDAGSPAWSPDGTKIAYTVAVGVTSRTIWVMNADGSHPVQVTDLS